ncbi:MAG: S-ribosylhomocysteine lyase [Clostridiales bacterium]|jgi:S-ribosylhomocysteine lyase|nr:S-ribosylhomocysteine lyase [Clostridiales bacterium]
MKKIASFCVDHNKLEPGMYISRIDDDIVTYDLRFIKPNCPPFLEVPSIHTFEHLFATMARNSQFQDRVVYFGPMGCRTGFYLLLRNLEHADAITLVQEVVKAIANYEGEIPGNTAVECGNYLEHSLTGAKQQAAKYYQIVKNWTIEQLSY